MTRSFSVACILMMAASAHCGAREPTPDEKAEIARVLLGSGYEDWRRIDLQDEWVVEGVYRSNGEICDLKIRAQTHEIFDEDCD